MALDRNDFKKIQQIPSSAITEEDFAAIYQFLNENGIQASLGWHNFTNSVLQPGAIVIDTKRKREVIAIVKVIAKLNAAKKEKNEPRIIYRGAAGGHGRQSYSATPINDADIIIRQVGAASLRVSWVNQAKYITRVGASLQVGPLDQTLHKNFHAKVTHSPSLIVDVSNQGLVAIGGNGTGLHCRGYSSNAVRFKTVLPDGEILILEKDSNQTGELFAAIAPAHMGNVGIVLNTDFQCEPSIKLKLNRIVMTFENFLERAPELFSRYSFAEAMIMAPYTDATDVVDVAFYGFTPVAVETEDKNLHVNFRAAEQGFQMEIEEGFHITDFLAEFPHLITLYIKYICDRIAIQNASNEEEIEIIGPFPDVYHYQVKYPHQLKLVEAIAPLSEDHHELVEACRDVRNLLLAAREKGDYPVTFTAGYVRTFNGTPGGLSPSTPKEGKRVFAYDVETSPGAPGLHDFTIAFVKLFVEKFGANLHPGKFAPVPGDPYYEELKEYLDYPKMLGQGMEDYKVALSEIYSARGMNYQESPLINHFAGHFLGLKDKYIPEPRFQSPDTMPKAISTLGNVIRRAKLFKELLEKEVGDHTASLLSELGTLITHHEELWKKEQATSPKLFSAGAGPSSSGISKGETRSLVRRCCGGCVAQ